MISSPSFRFSLPLRSALSRWSLGCASAVCLLFQSAAGAGVPKPRLTDPVISIPLEPLGFTGIPTRFLMGAASMFTLNFVDSTHVLFTYSARTLIPRSPDPDPMDDDRNVAALLLELPSGKVLARTEWHTRDHEQYLWPLTHGRFLFRSRNRLTVIDPVRMLPTGDAFRQEPFADLKRRIGYISVAPEGDLVVVETIPRRKPEVRLGGAAASQAALAATVPGYKPPPKPEPGPEEDDDDRRVPVQVHFFRVVNSSEPGQAEHVVAQSAGLVYSRNLLNLPTTADGYLSANKESSQSWDFDFHTHTGKRSELAVFDTTCSPHPYFITRSDFIAFGCRYDGQELGGFNLRGEHNWIFAFTEHYVTPTLVAAPSVGRFALSRTLVSSQLVDMDNLVPELITAQEVSVLQVHDGRVLLKVQTSPVQRVGENFDLSADGMSLAILRAGNLEIYRLPPLTGKDQAELKRSIAADPEKNDVAILLDSTPVEKRKEARAEGVPVGGEVLKPTAAEPAPVGAAGEQLPPAKLAQQPEQLGDVQSTEPRKPPTLYDADHPKPTHPE